MTTQSLTPSIAVADVPVRQDADGRYCLNDLHKAAGGEQKHRPKYWLENQQTVELIAEIAKGGIPPLEQNQPVVSIQGGNAPGTFVVRELVYAYAMWISASFHLKVIRTFDAVMTGNTASVETLLPSEQQTLMEIVHAKVGDYPKETQGKALAEIWSRIHNKYRIAKYDQLPRTQLAEVILYVTQMELKTKGASPQRLSPRELQALTHLVNEIADKLHFGGAVRTATCRWTWRSSCRWWRTTRRDARHPLTRTAACASLRPGAQNTSNADTAPVRLAVFLYHPFTPWDVPVNVPGVGPIQ